MGDNRSRETVLFSFNLSDLNEIRDRRQQQTEKEFMLAKFQEWSLGDSDLMQLSYGELEQIITSTSKNAESQEGAKLLVTWAERIGAVLKSLGLSKSQIRNIFGTVRQIDMGWPTQATKEEEQTQVRYAARQVLLLKPKLAYQAQRTPTISRLAAVLDPALDLVGTNREHFSNLVDFFEAILAYHTAFGGK
jgi:CRISPR-associated protein Csm2